MPGQKLFKVGGVPASPKLSHISESVTPEQGRYYSQAAVNRSLVPLRYKLSTVIPAGFTGAGVDATLKAILKGNTKVPGPRGKVYPTNSSQANSPQGVRKGSVTRKP